MILLMEVVEEVLGWLEVVGVQTMMARHRRELVAAVAAVETQIAAAMMVPAAVPALAMETVAVVVVVVVIPVDQVELEEQVERLPTRIPAVVVDMEEMIMPLVKS